VNARRLFRITTAMLRLQHGFTKQANFELDSIVL
jgi:hypothetical protein